VQISRKHFVSLTYLHDGINNGFKNMIQFQNVGRGIVCKNRLKCTRSSYIKKVKATEHTETIVNFHFATACNILHIIKLYILIFY